MGSCLSIGESEGSNDSPVSDFIMGAEESNKIK